MARVRLATFDLENLDDSESWFHRHCGTPL